MRRRMKFIRKAVPAILSIALVFGMIPAYAFAAGTIDMTKKLSIGDLDYYYAEGSKGDTFKVAGSEVAAKEIDDSGVFYYATGETPETMYGSAAMTYAQYWQGEQLSAPNAEYFDAAYDGVDSENTYDLGGFDAVTRPTVKHGIFRHGFQFTTRVTGIDEDGHETSLFVEQDPDLSTGKLTAKPRDGGSADAVVMADMAKKFESDGKSYDIKNYEVLGFQRIPVKVKGTSYVKAMILNQAEKGTKTTKVFNDVVIGGKDGSGKTVTAATGGIKELKADGTYGPAAPGKTNNEIGFDIAADEEKLQYNYSGKWGEFGTAYIYLKKANGEAMSNTEFLAYGANFLTAKYGFYGEDASCSGEPIATYGTKNAADTWWSANHGVRIDAGFLYEALRLGGTGEKGNKQLGYWKVTLKAAGYNDVEAKIHLEEPIDSISLSETNLELYTGDSKTLTGTFDPENTTADKTLKWVSSDPDIAKVDDEGNVTGVKAGEATITATTVNGKEASCKVTVKSPELKLSPTKATIYTKTKKTVSLKATVAGGSTAVAWESSNPAVAAVSSKGIVTAKKAGTTTITAKANGCKATCKVTVKKPSLTLAKSSAKIKKGKTVTIKAKAAPTAKITYKSNKTKVATVSSKGVVKGKKKGTAKITVSSNGVKKTFKVTVK